MSEKLVNAIAEMDEDQALALTKELLDCRDAAAGDPGGLPRRRWSWSASGSSTGSTSSPS